MPLSHPLAVQHPLYQSIASAAGSGDLMARLTAGFAAIANYLMANGRKLIDEPAERQQAEAVAVQAFNALFGAELGITATAVIDGMLVKAIDKILVALAAEPPAPTPAPVVPAVPQGSAR